MAGENKKKTIKCIIQILLLALFAAPILFFYLFATPYQRGFYCSDTSIRYNYKESTVTSLTLYFVGTLLPVISVVIIELVRTHQKEIPVPKWHFLCIKNKDAMCFFYSIYITIGAFLFGCAASHFTVDICKYAVGRLRPHFIDVCKPDFSQVNCSGYQYIYPAPCQVNTEEEVDRLKEARLSFFSGHASFSAYTMIFLIIYLQRRMLMDKTRILRPMLQFIFFALALYTGLSRISDHKHHWSDVLTGFLNGLIYAVIVTYFVSDVFRSPPKYNEHTGLVRVEDGEGESIDTQMERVTPRARGK